MHVMILNIMRIRLFIVMRTKTGEAFIAEVCLDRVNAPD